MSDELRERFRQAAVELVAPGAAAADEQGRFDRNAFGQLGERGLLRAFAPQAFGGEGLGLRGAAAAIEGLAMGSDDLGFTVSVMAHLVATQLLVEHADAAQQARWLPRLLSGEWLAGVANSEPRAGTDVLGLRSRARPSGDDFALSGRKRSITNVGEADLLLVSARLSGVSAREAINAFVLELPAAGAYVRPIRDLTGLRSSPTGDLLLRGVSVPGVARLGEVGSGVELFRSTFSWERLLCGYVFLATLRRAQLRALTHAEEREQFGQAIGRNQHVQERIVRMHVAEQLLFAHLAATLDAACAGRDVFGALSVIKIYGLEAALDAAQSLVRILGGRGLRRQAAAEKMLRDVVTLSVFGGTVELHKSIAYSELVRRRAAPPAPAAPSEPEFELLSAAQLSPRVVAELTALVADALPARAELCGRYYFDTPPDEVLLARRAGQLIGFRAISYREL
ncbi:MAG TPA: acyl-CoA dehydrogenase family protein, partial [Polyangiaceae bacterium]|nr:acyl-CoA dehydrogenase family protein [Polyangiaceae bacterium]